MHVTVDPQRCQGHTLCAMTAPEVFVLGEDDGHAHVAEAVATDGVPAAAQAAVRDAVAGCPEMAISITEA